MGRERLTWIIFVAALLLAGLLIGHQFLLDTGETQEDKSERSFREWFWESRALDLIAQVGLIFAGALGIAALLPREKETDDT
ncbi:MAG: hypothetical protein JXA14_12520 [Anaerolineae bacterium]|nr:hypothetical protein [Anaerolineae bacterium]